MAIEKGNSNFFILAPNLKDSDDTLKLWQTLDGNSTLICKTSINYQEDIGTTAAPFFRLTRSIGGEWNIDFSLSGKETDALQIGSGREISLQQGKYSGFMYSYSSSQDRKLWIDSLVVYGSFYMDTIPPAIDSIYINDVHTLFVYFSEPVYLNSAEGISLSANDLDTAWVTENMLVARFISEFPNRAGVQFNISGVYDRDGNMMRDTLIMITMQLPEFGDVVISEVMTDPEPPVYLPECEYLELLNRTANKVSLRGWSIQINGRSYLLKEDTVPSGAYVLLTCEDPICNFDGAHIMHIFSSESAVPNSGGMIRLYDQFGRLIHFLEYEEMEKYEGYNGEGGQSVECIDLSNLCGGRENMAASKSDLGGTPGKINSRQGTFQDLDKAELLYLGVPDEQSLSITFNEAVKAYSPGTTYSIDGIKVEPLVDTSNIISKNVRLHIPDGFDIASLYSIEMEKVTDCAGNSLERIEKEFQLPDRPNSGTIVINELMYDPLSGGNEYIEIFNNSEKYYDLYDLKLSISKDCKDETSTAFLSDYSHLIGPDEYVVFCRDRLEFIKEWNVPSGIDVAECPNWKNLPGKQGCIQLTDRAENIVDQVLYSDSLHSDLLEITSGVALEKITHSCAGEEQCWSSASFMENYGTPGRQNSQYCEFQEEENVPSITPTVFSPDGDGFEDVIEITLPVIRYDELVSIFITDLNGLPVRDLISGVIGGRQDRLFWDGKGNNGNTAPPGLYVLHIRISGKTTRKYRKVCALVYRD